MLPIWLSAEHPGAWQLFLHTGNGIYYIACEVEWVVGSHTVPLWKGRGRQTEREHRVSLVSCCDPSQACLHSPQLRCLGGVRQSVMKAFHRWSEELCNKRARNQVRYSSFTKHKTKPSLRGENITCSEMALVLLSHLLHIYFYLPFFLRNDGTEFGGSIYQKVNDQLETAVNLAWTAGNSNTRFGIAAKYQIDPDASFSVSSVLF